jgi:hypothetical protein
MTMIKCLIQSLAQRKEQEALAKCLQVSVRRQDVLYFVLRSFNLLVYTRELFDSFKGRVSSKTNSSILHLTSELTNVLLFKFPLPAHTPVFPLPQYVITKLFKHTI